MYQIGDKVLYGMQGVCVVTDQEKRVVDKKTVTYLVLEPVGQEGSRYLVPTHNEAAMAKLRKILTKEELATLLDSPEVRNQEWIQDENHRKQLYRELISSGDRLRLMQMVHTLYNHRSAQKASGRKCHLCDENFLRDAEKLLSGEISLVMELDAEGARQFLRDKLKAE